jgi:hypothetical protein
MFFDRKFLLFVFQFPCFKIYPEADADMNSLRDKTESGVCLREDGKRWTIKGGGGGPGVKLFKSVPPCMSLCVWGGGCEKSSLNESRLDYLDLIII